MGTGALIQDFTVASPRNRITPQLAINPVAVEKLLLSKSTKMKTRQEALQSIFSGRLDIFYPPNFG
jgi:hypothetical protein